MLSSSDILKWFNVLKLNEPNIISYDELKNKNFIPSSVNFILYEQIPNMGHWVLVFYNTVNHCYEFFDSYGFMIDDELKYTYYKDKKRILTEQFLETGQDLFEINDVVFQGKKQTTCGMWCAIRYFFNILGFSKKEFDNFFNQEIITDIKDDIIKVLYDEIPKIYR